MEWPAQKKLSRKSLLGGKMEYLLDANHRHNDRCMVTGKGEEPVARNEGHW